MSTKKFLHLEIPEEISWIYTFQGYVYLISPQAISRFWFSDKWNRAITDDINEFELITNKELLDLQLQGFKIVKTFHRNLVMSLQLFSEDQKEIGKYVEIIIDENNAVSITVVDANVL